MLQFTHIYVSLPHGSMLNRIKDALLMREGKGRVRALEDITLWIGRGESWALLGEKDSGKTTLARLAARHIPPDAGLYSVGGSVASAIHGEEGFFRNETGEGNARMAFIADGVKEEAQRLHEAKRLFADDALFHKPVSAFRDCDKAKLSLCIALSGKPDVLIISNQLEYCEKPFQQQCIFELRRRQREGMTLLLECADEALMSRLCESAVWLHEGKLQRLGTLESVWAAKRASTALGMEEGKRWLNSQMTAFSAPLNPTVSKSDQELERYAKRLHEQLQAYAQANHVYEEENQKLRAQVQKNKARLDANEKLLLRTLTAFQSTLEVMHEQFLVLRGKEEARKALRAPKPF